MGECHMTKSVAKSLHIFICFCNLLTRNIISCKTTYSDDTFHAIITVDLSEGAIALSPSVNMS